MNYNKVALQTEPTFYEAASGTTNDCPGDPTEHPLYFSRSGPPFHAIPRLPLPVGNPL